MRPSRRLIVAAAVVAPFVVRSGALGATDPFTLGVASGEPTADGFVRILPGLLEDQGGLDGFFAARLVRSA